MAIGDFASGIAAVAALLTVYYARATVAEARRSRREASAAHGEEMSREGQLLDATQAAHQQEMSERQRALASELWLQRLTQLGRVNELLGETADIARIEIANPPAKVAGGLGSWTRVTGALVRVEAALIILEQLGGPSLGDIKQMTIDLRRMNTRQELVVTETMGALDRIKYLAQEHASFKSPADS